MVGITILITEATLSVQKHDYLSLLAEAADLADHNHDDVVSSDELRTACSQVPQYLSLNCDHTDSFYDFPQRALQYYVSWARAASLPARLRDEVRNTLRMSFGIEGKRSCPDLPDHMCNFPVRQPGPDYTHDPPPAGLGLPRIERREIK